MIFAGWARRRIARGRRSHSPSLWNNGYAAIEARAARATTRPRVLCLEWLDPYYVGGHWVPEMVAKAGGEDVLGRAGTPSFRVSAEQIAESRADVIVVMPCGYGKERVAAECRVEDFPADWRDLPAMRERRIFAVDANSYFSRPGPRLADGVALLAHLLHPDLFPGAAPANSFCRVIESVDSTSSSGTQSASPEPGRPCRIHGASTAALRVVVQIDVNSRVGQSRDADFPIRKLSIKVNN